MEIAYKKGRAVICSAAVMLVFMAGIAACETVPAAEHATIASKPRPLVDATEQVGLDFVHENGATGNWYFPEILGSGAALFDYDRDGDLDLYLVQGCVLETGSNASLRPAPSDRLFRNELIETGALRFTDVTDLVGIAAPGYGHGVATGDLNGDGWIDVYVTNFGANQLWRNKGDGTFTDATFGSGLEDPGWSTSASFLDYDRDGRLDVMVTHYDIYSIDNDSPCTGLSGRRDYCGPNAYQDERDRLYRNLGDGTFEDVSLEAGIAASYGSGLGVAAADFNGDGWTDLAVANDGDDNQLWINQQGAHFENQARLSGVAVNASGFAEAGMGVSAADFDNDGDYDVLMTHLKLETNTLYLNTGAGLFQDKTTTSGIGLASLAFTSFGVSEVDLDNDGLLDLFVANGEVREIVAPEVLPDIPFGQPNQIFWNLGGGRFKEGPREGDPALEIAEISRGLAFGDVDNDGDNDLVVTNVAGPARLLLNQIGERNAWLGLSLVDSITTTHVYGAEATLVRAGQPFIVRTVHTDGSYLSAHEPRILFGLGANPAYEAVRVRWPDGSIEQWTELQSNRYHTLVRGGGIPVEAS